MSKTRKTNHEDYNYIVESIDKFDWASKPYAISDVFNTEQEAVDFKQNYCLNKKSNLLTDPFQKVVITRVSK